MKNWYMLALVGKDRPGIVARITRTLFEQGCNLGEASMTRIGGNFSVMLMIEAGASASDLKQRLSPLSDELQLTIHIDQIEGALHSHVEPDVRISVYGSDRMGIVAETTEAAASAGLNIVHLESDVAGTKDEPIYIMHIEGVANDSIEAIESALNTLSKEKGVETRVTAIDTLLG